MTYRYFREDKTVSASSPFEDFLFMGEKTPQQVGITTIPSTPTGFGKKRAVQRSGRKTKRAKGAV